MSKKGKSLKALAKESVQAVNILDQIATAPKEESKVSLPLTIKPDQINGKTIGGEIMGFHAYKGKGFKGTIVQFKHESGTTFGFPLVGVLRHSLARHVGKDTESLSIDDVRGLNVSVRGMGKGKTRDGKRAMNMLEVFIDSAE